MKRTNKFILSGVAVIAITIAAAGLVSAQGRWAAHCDQMGPFGGAYQGQDASFGHYGKGDHYMQKLHHRGKYSDGDRAAMMEKRLNQAKEKLQITGDQEPAWIAFADQLKTHMTQWGEQRQNRSSEGVTGIEQRVEWMREKSARLNRMADAVVELYGQLTPEQQKVADMMQIRRKGRHGRGGF